MTKGEKTRIGTSIFFRKTFTDRCNMNLNSDEDEIVPVQSAPEVIENNIVTHVPSDGDTTGAFETVATSRKTTAIRPSISNTAERSDDVNCDNIVYEREDSEDAGKIIELNNARKDVNGESEYDDECNPHCLNVGDNVSNWAPKE